MGSKKNINQPKGTSRFKAGACPPLRRRFPHGEVEQIDGLIAAHRAHPLAPRGAAGTDIVAEAYVTLRFKCVCLISWIPN